MMIAFLLAALALQSEILAVSAVCPKLPSIPLAYPIYRGCTTETQVVNRTCIVACVSDYSLENEPITRFSFQFVCQANGTWSGKIRKCVGKFAALSPHAPIKNDDDDDDDDDDYDDDDDDDDDNDDDNEFSVHTTIAFFVE
ncbi:hypothetical protein ACROYT_G019740 [Oculina patagonica]